MFPVLGECSVMVNKRRSTPDSVTESGDTYTSKNGIVFKLKKVSSWIARDARTALHKPKPPKYFNDEKGREEDNESDPDYLEALSAYNEQVGLAAIYVYLTFGTEIKEKPADVENVGSTDWSDTLKEIGIAVPDNGKRRYFLWLKYYALPYEEDFDNMFYAVAGYSGQVREVDVKNEENSFRSDETRNATETVPISEEG